MNSNKIEIDCATKRVKDWSDFILRAMKDGDNEQIEEGKKRVIFAISRLEFALSA
jgi:hypothetical protein